jgi:subfamily B ATP-binding cassette protein HlyB/CyaB
MDADQLRHRYAVEQIGFTEMLRAAKDIDVKARLVRSNIDKLRLTPLPAIFCTRDGNFWVVGKATEDKVLVQDPYHNAPTLITSAEFDALWTGELFLMSRRSSLRDLTRRFDITWFLQATYKYRNLLYEVLIASFFLQLFALATPIFFQVIVDKVLVHHSISTLNVLIFGFLTISVFESLLTALRTYVFSHTTSRMDVELGARLFRHLAALPIAYFEARRTGDSVARVRELETIRNFITSSALTLIIDLFFTFVFLIVMAYYSVTLTLIVIASFPLYVAISAFVTPMFQQRLNEKFSRGADSQAFLVESIAGIQTLKASAVEPQMQRRWEEQLAGYVNANFNVLNLGNWASQGVQLISKIITALTLYFGARAVIAGTLSVGELVAFNMLAGRVSQPVLRLAQIWQDFQQTRISVERLGDILNSPPEPAFTPSKTSMPAIRGDINFNHVTFRYRPDAATALNDVHLHIPAGQVVGIVGPSGSGKSTLTKLVQRFYAPENGQVLIDGTDLGMVDVSWLRRQVGVVLQENVLFNCSVRENIALSDPGAPIEQVMQAAKLAGAHDFILELPNGYDSDVGERGGNLSGGQRQRIAIARALITNPRILIFDEATSALDYESEHIIQKNMQTIAKSRTVMIIAHRLSAVRHCDRIITLEKGRIVEDGTHDTLSKTNGRYASLLRIQGEGRAA